MYLICFSIKMTQYNALNVKLFNPQHNKLKKVIKNGTELTLNFSLIAAGDSNDELILCINYY